MDRFRNAIAELSACLWDEAVTSEAALDPAEFEKLLGQIKSIFSARKLMSLKPLSEPLKDRDIASANAFLKFMFQTKEADQQLEKLARLQHLDGRSLGVLAILCTGVRVHSSTPGTISTLLQGVETIAKWSDWPNDPRLQRVVVEYQPQAEFTVDSPLPVRSACEQTTKSTSPAAITTTTAASDLSAIASTNHGSTPPLPATTDSAIDGDTGSELEAERSRKRLRKETNPLDAAATNLRPPTTTGDLSDSHTAAPSSLGQTRTSQSSSTEACQPGSPSAIQTGTTLAAQHARSLLFPRRARLDAARLCSYLTRHIPEDIEFNYDNRLYTSPMFNPTGVQFQITSAWCKERGLGVGSRFHVQLQVLLSGILNHLRQCTTEGFGWFNAPVQDMKITIWWWHIDRQGDGAVWPNAFGDLVVRWQRPVHIDNMMKALS